MDEVTFMLRLLQDNWSVGAIKAGLASHQTTPVFIDIRSIEPGKGNRVDLDSNAIIIVYEDNHTSDHPTIDHAVRNETYSFTLHLRVLHRRDFTELTFSRDRLQSLYRIARYILEKNSLRPKVHTDANPHIDSSGVLNTTTVTESGDLLEITGRSEANDRRKKLLGYKITVNLKRFGQSV